MIGGSGRSWIDRSERYLGWIALPNIGLILVTLQGLGYLMVLSDPAWAVRLALFPGLVRGGEYWRLITFLALPLTTNFIWVVFGLWFLFFILRTIEEQWGAYKTTLYVLTSVVVTIAYSFAFDYPITQISHFQSTLFLAAAALFPNFTILLFFVLPVAMKWLGLLTGALVILEMVRGDWLDRGHLIAIYSNFLLFFGPAFIDQGRNALRRWQYKRKLRS